MSEEAIASAVSKVAISPLIKMAPAPFAFG
jgi:hypothetical protein